MGKEEAGGALKAASNPRVFISVTQGEVELGQMVAISKPGWRACVFHHLFASGHIASQERHGHRARVCRHSLARLSLLPLSLFLLYDTQCPCNLPSFPLHFSGSVGCPPPSPPPPPNSNQDDLSLNLSRNFGKLSSGKRVGHD